MKPLKNLFFIFILLFSIGLYAEEKVFLNHISMKGNISFLRKEILKALNLKEQKSYFAKDIRNKIDQLQDFYHKKGYTLCRVSGFVDLESNLIITIREGIIKKIFFNNLGYLEVFMVRDEFGNYKDKIFFKPTIEQKLEKVKKITGSEDFNFDFLPVENEIGYFYLFISKKVKKISKKSDLEPYSDIYFNFRGWALSLVPFAKLTFHNLFHVDHSIRFKVDIRLATQKWLDMEFQDSVINEYYTMNYFSPPFYKKLRFNLETGVLINRQGRSDLDANFKTIRFPFSLGVGFDFKYFWTSLRVGYIYEKLRNIDLGPDTLVTNNQYPELFSVKDEKYTTITAHFNQIKRKKFHNEKDDVINLQMDYTFNKNFNWFNFLMKSEHFFLSGYDVFVLRTRAFFMTGNYPVYFQLQLPGEYRLRGYGALYTDRAVDGVFEIWNSLDKDFLHNIFFIDIAWFNNETYDTDLAMGDFALTYGLGVSFSWEELNLRLYWSLPLKERADKGEFNFFFRKRF